LANVRHPSDFLWPGYILVRLPVKAFRLPLNGYVLVGLPMKVCGIPHLAKNERDMGHPAFVVDLEKGSVEHYGYFVGGKSLGGVAGIAGAYRGFVILMGGDFLFQHVR
jgi:hypothetical protein